jgi:DNA-binding response OmpR family regulator
VRGLSDTLAGHGFDVTVATGQAGLDEALKGEADLILLD